MDISRVLHATKSGVSKLGYRLRLRVLVNEIFLCLHAQNNKKKGYLRNLTETKSIKVHINAATDGKVKPTGKDVEKQTKLPPVSVFGLTSATSKPVHGQPSPAAFSSRPCFRDILLF